MPFIGGVFMSGVLMLGGFFGFHAAGSGGEAAANPLLDWKERQALCQTADTAKDQVLCELMKETAATSAP